MPLYEFECKSCHTLVEYLMKMSDPNPTTCESCGAESLSKIVSKSNFVLKGQGWYETDFKDKPKKDSGSNANSTASSKETKKSDSDSTEAKQTKTEAKSTKSGDSSKTTSSQSSGSTAGKTTATAP